MPDNKNVSGPADSARINSHEGYEIRYWTNRFGCTKEQLVACVQCDGVMAADGKRCLGKEHMARHHTIEHPPESDESPAEQQPLKGAYIGRKSRRSDTTRPTRPAETARCAMVRDVERALDAAGSVPSPLMSPTC